MEKELMPNKINTILVMGAGGFIGGHLIKRST
jgi:nucleoside-diphosphate-sugar epimerase